MSQNKRHSFKCGEDVSSNTRYYPYIVSHECGGKPVIGKFKGQFNGKGRYLCQRHYDKNMPYFSHLVRLLTSDELEMIAKRESEYAETHKSKVNQ